MANARWVTLAAALAVATAGGQQAAPVVWLVPALLPVHDRLHPGASVALSF